MKNNELPIINVRDMTFFPGVEKSLFIGRKITIDAIEYSLRYCKGYIGVFTQKRVEQNSQIKRIDFFSVGINCKIVQHQRMTDGSVRVFLKAGSPIKLSKMFLQDGVRIGNVQKIQYKSAKAALDEKQKIVVLKNLLRWNPQIALGEDTNSLTELKNAKSMANFIDKILQLICCPITDEASASKWTKKSVSVINQGLRQRQAILIEKNISKRVELINKLLKSEFIAS